MEKYLEEIETPSGAGYTESITHIMIGNDVVHYAKINAHKEKDIPITKDMFFEIKEAWKLQKPTKLILGGRVSERKPNILEYDEIKLLIGEDEIFMG